MQWARRSRGWVGACFSTPYPLNPTPYAGVRQFPRFCLLNRPFRRYNEHIMKPKLPIALSLLAFGATLAGCARARTPSIATVPAANASPVPRLLPLEARPEYLVDRVVDGYRRRILRHRTLMRDMERIVTEMSPLVAAAARQAQGTGALRRMAQENGTTLEEARERWKALQEADLLLESSGDPDAVSVSNAVGVAQWLAGTARANGLPVDLAASHRLSVKIDALKWRIAWYEYLQRPDADRTLPGAPAASPADAAAQLPALRKELEMLRQKRRRLDTRYDPRRAIFAQARYLLRLYPRFPSPDWLFQAYHGGEGGVQRTLRRYCGAEWPGSAAAAIRYGQDGRALPYEDLYFTTKPRSHADAFLYLYGRSDDHRHYWWKLRASQDLIALYRRDPAAFRAEWEAALPGRPVDAFWYPQAAGLSLADLPALQAERANHQLVPVNPRTEFVLQPARDDPQNAACYAALRPEAKGALLLVATAYRRVGGPGQLTIGDMALTQEYVARSRAQHPPPPPKGPIWPPDPEAHALPGNGPPPDFDFHTTGLAFDILRPSNPRQRRVLEYALGYFEDRQILAWIDAKDRGERRYHVVPNPYYAEALAEIASTGQMPELPGL